MSIELIKHLSLTCFDAICHYLALTAPFLILGLVFGGIVYIWIPLKLIKKWLGKEDMFSVLRAAFFGIPLPLCSCSVIPTSVSLRRSGASKAATSSFVISTPESGVDSIAVTYAMMDLPMMIFRPVAAFASAVFGGMLQIVFNLKSETEISPQPEEELSESEQGPQYVSVIQKIKASLKYGFGDLLDDISGWFLFGIFLGAAFHAFLPDSFFEHLDPNVTRFLFIFIGLPLYLCASATTPIAAALVLKGVSPGAALILLLVGPATSIPNMLVLKKVLGVRGVMLNVFAVAFIALLFSYIVDWFYVLFDWSLFFRVSQEHEHLSNFDHWLALLIFVLLLQSFVRVNFLTKKHHHGHNHSHDHCCK